MSGAEEGLIAAWGSGGGRCASAWAPGRCTIAGEHVDYALGVVLAFATDLGVEAAVRDSPAGRWRLAAGEKRIERDTLDPRGDQGDRVFAAIESLRRRGIRTAPLDVATAATLPPGAGLSSSAAVICATIAAVLRHAGAALSAAELVAAALIAEREIVGVPCGILDPSVVVHARRDAVVRLDCRTESVTTAPWPWDGGLVFVACATDDAHDVGAGGYRERRAEADEALRRAGIESVQDDPAQTDLPPPLDRRLRHMVFESRRSDEARRAIDAGDAAALGRAMNASHDSLRDDFEVTTPRLDAVVEAARGLSGCFGARMVGAGFGGTVVALVEEGAAGLCAATMAAAADVDTSRTWQLLPAPGVVELCTDIIAAG